jgi:DNA mismatch repair ATPase MutS
MRLRPFQALFSSIDTTDNIELGYSYYFSEVRRVKTLATLLQRGDRTFALFDEMFKGTNVQDAHEATLAIVTKLADHKGSIFIVSSHLIELADSLKQTETVQFQSFAAVVADGMLEYDYHLNDGVSDQRLGMLILQRDGVLDMLARPEDRDG